MFDLQSIIWQNVMDQIVSLVWAVSFTIIPSDWAMWLLGVSGKINSYCAFDIILQDIFHFAFLF